MTDKKKMPIIPLEVIPVKDSRIVKGEAGNALLVTDIIYTGYEFTCGEMSAFFIALKDGLKILGSKCPKCGIIRCPVVMKYCPDCEFEEMELVELPDIGIMASTASITYFAHALFQYKVPFGRGYVFLGDSVMALPVNVYTTKGLLTSGVFKKDTAVKIVFRDQREGRITDIFAVPAGELSEEQLAKSPLMESDLVWEESQEPKIEPTDDGRTAFVGLMLKLGKFAAQVTENERARKDINAQCTIQVKTGGGPFVIYINNGEFRINEGESGGANFVLCCSIETLLNWISLRECLVNAIIRGDAWIPSGAALPTIFKLDRVPRSLTLVR